MAGSRKMVGEMKNKAKLCIELGLRLGLAIRLDRTDGLLKVNFHQWSHSIEGHISLKVIFHKIVYHLGPLKLSSSSTEVVFHGGCFLFQVVLTKNCQRSSLI